MRVLYLGSDPKEFPCEGELIHCPLIKIVPRNPHSPQIKSAFDDLPSYTHILFTSKHAVRVFLDDLLQLGGTRENLKDKKLIAIGKVTEKTLQQEGLQAALTAEEETQEGIIQSLRPFNLQDAYFFLPRSSLSRPLLTHFLREREIRYQACDIYDTLPQKPDPLPNIEEVDEIVFTSPSTVNAFLQIFSKIPEEKKLTVSGPITEHALKKHMINEQEVFYV
jgi:uroporphyrinogen-III synthase